MGDLHPGQVIFRSSREVIVLVGEERWVCELRGTLRRRGSNAVVVGDRVEVFSDGAGRGRVERILPRERVLSRRRESGRGRELVIAANVHQVVAVFAARRPRPQFGALDRLLVAAEAAELDAWIVLNKCDLGVSEEVAEELAVYEEIGYRVIRTSQETGEGLEELAAALRGRSSVVSGPSGVGKSSLIGPLVGEELRVGEVSASNEKGRHTTTAVTWYPLPGGGAVLDTPGFRDYAIWSLEPGDLAGCFRELIPRLGGCRFSDCLHREEPACGVRDAVEEGSVDPRRYFSYLGILDSLEEQRPARG